MSKPKTSLDTQHASVWMHVEADGPIKCVWHSSVAGMLKISNGLVSAEKGSQ